MDIYEALYTTRAMRRVKPDPIPLDVQRKILDAAIRAPTGGNMQGWRFLLIDDPHVRTRLGALYRECMDQLWGSIYKDRIDAAPDIFAIDRPHTDDISRAADSTGIHPIIRRYAHGKLVSTHHVIEDLFSEWKQAKHFEPLAEYFASEFSQSPAPGGFGPPSKVRKTEGFSM